MKLGNIGLVKDAIRDHPLTKDAPRPALQRWLRWQVSSRLAPGPIAVPWVDDTQLLLSAGMWGGTMNVYCGLQDFDLTGFMLHLLNKEDLFVDAGANIGIFSILASGVRRCQTIAVEPVSKAADHIRAAAQLNGITNFIDIQEVVLSDEPGEVSFTADLDTLNHVDTTANGAGSISVPALTLDKLVDGAVPTFIKIDVEGYETPVLAGATEVLAAPGLLALSVELDGHGARYGFDEASVPGTLNAAGLEAAAYDPLTRSLSLVGDAFDATENSLFVRAAAIEEIRERLASSPAFRVLDRSV